jgi:two-component system, NtrC family, sensor kinase
LGLTSDPSKTAPSSHPESSAPLCDSPAQTEAHGRAEQQLQRSNLLLRALTEAQLEFIQGIDAHNLFNKLLGVLLDLTSSEYGFIGEVFSNEKGEPFLRTHAITNIAWTDELRAYYDRMASSGIEFRNLRTLFGAVLTSGEAVVANMPAKDPRRGGLPDGHPALNAFLGLPFKSGGEMVGMVGIANRPGGYDAEVIEFLQPFLATCSSIIIGWRSEQRRRRAEEMLRHNEEELRRHRDQLEELVQIRTEKLLRATQELEAQQLQLIQSEKLASLGQVAAGIAHEINNPMGYIMSNLSSLTQYVSVFTGLLRLYRELETAVAPSLQGPLAELLARIQALRSEENLDYLLNDVGELLQDSHEGAQRVKDIVQSLRIFVREEAGPPQLLDVNKELATALKMMRNQLDERCEVRCDYGELPPILGYPTQLSQVFTNLLSNAAQAITDRGEIRIATRLEGKVVVARISDTGHGMTPEVVSKLFTPFFTTKPPGKGTGLGLSISYNIISRHQGRIEVESQPGQGTTFILRLPVAQGTTESGPGGERLAVARDAG